MTKKRKFWVLIAMLSIALLTCRMSAKPEIVAVHLGYIVLLKNPPLTEAGAIRWWQTNRKYLKARYNMPRDESRYVLGILNFGDGYRADTHTDQDSDLLCFEDMPIKANCIEKDLVLHISKGRNGMWVNEEWVKND